MASPNANTYTIHKSATISTAITIMQLQASATKPFEILRAWCTQSSSTATNQISIALLRKNAAATVTAAVSADIGSSNPSNATTCGLQLGIAGTGYNASVEGTDGVYLDDWGFNVLTGWLWLPVPEERTMVAANGVIALKFTTAPASGTFRFGMTINELG